MRVVRSYKQYLIKSIATLVLLSIASTSYAGGGLMELVGLGSCNTPESCTPDSGAFSSTGPVQTQKVNTGYANKLKTLIENGNNLLCPLWNGLDQYGRKVAYDSYYSTTPTACIAK